MKKVLLLSKISFKDFKEEEKNIATINKVTEYLERNHFEVINLRDLMIEVNQRSSAHQHGPRMTVDKNSWNTFCCLNFVLSSLAYCDHVFVCDDCENCLITLSVVTMAQIMGLSMLYIDENKNLKEEKFPGLVLPYIDYDLTKNESPETNIEEAEVEPQKIITPRSRADEKLGNWFDRAQNR